MRNIHRFILASGTAMLGGIIASGLVSSAQDKAITVYSGRSQALVEPLVKQFERESGIKVNVKYATDAALVAAIQEEGSRSPADVFWANTSGALGVAAKAKLLKTLPANLRGKSAAFTPESGTWTPISVRFRVLAYNNKTVKAEELPASVMDLTKLSKFKGKIGWTPTYSSFQDFVGAMIALKGPEASKTWLDGIKVLEPKNYAASNTAMMEALKAGEIDIALTNHYYIQRFVKSGAPIGTHYFAAGDPGSLALITGAGILSSSKKTVDAQKLLRYLLEPKSQQYFTGEVFEYPVISSVILPGTLLPFNEMVNRSPKIDQEKSGELLEPAQKLLRDAGII
jgi:iron(III) transport system substrate-binding protein